MGENLDIRRLRGNLVVGDLPAWDEFSWLGKRIAIGEAELEVLRPAQRCPATSVNPQTGERDLKVPDAMNDHFGHAFCGMYAKVVKSGRISVGGGFNSIRIVGDAKTPLAEAALPTAPDYRLWPKFAEIVSVDRLSSPFEAPLRSAPQDEESGTINGSNERLREVQVSKDEKDGTIPGSNAPHPEVRAERASKDEGKLLTIKSAGPWPLPDAAPGQRMRIHIGEDLIGVATVSDRPISGRDHTTALHVTPSPTRDPATAYLLEKAHAGTRLIVTGPYGRVA